MHVLAVKVILLLVFSNSILSKTVIAVVGKTKNDTFYEQAYEGCRRFAAEQGDVECIYDGPLDFQDVRSQSIVVNEILKKKIDGLLVSTTDSEFLTKTALVKAVERNIPVITFDSDLLPQHRQYRLAYVGTNNFDFGVALGEYAKKFKGLGRNEICIQSGHQTTPNLNHRINGVRFALSGKKDLERLNGENDWYESSRCPLYSLGQRPTALLQLKTMLKSKRPPIFLAVAGFAQFSPDYISSMQEHKEDIKSKSIVIISADTEDIQLKALNSGLSTVNIGQRPFEMGKVGAKFLYKFIKERKRPDEEFNYLDFHYCTQENSHKCIEK